MPRSEKPVEQWSVGDVVAFLEDIGLGNLEKAFRENAATGADLLELSADDLERDLSLTHIQASSVRSMFSQATR